MTRLAALGAQHDFPRPPGRVSTASAEPARGFNRFGPLGRALGRPGRLGRVRGPVAADALTPGARRLGPVAHGRSPTTSRVHDTAFARPADVRPPVARHCVRCMSRAASVSPRTHNGVQRVCGRRRGCEDSDASETDHDATAETPAVMCRDKHSGKPLAARGGLARLWPATSAIGTRFVAAGRCRQIASVPPKRCGRTAGNTVVSADSASNGKWLPILTAYQHRCQNAPFVRCVTQKPTAREPSAFRGRRSDTC